MAQQTNTRTQNKPNQRRVLIVEDDSVLRIAYRVVLTGADYVVEEAADGAEALERLARTADPGIGLVILDVGLPDMSGLDLLAKIRETHEERVLPVIVVTAADGLDERLCGLEAGANDYLVKPVALPELVARVNAQLQLMDRWRDRMAAVTDTRRRIAFDLRDINKTTDMQQAMNMITFAAAQFADVEGAVFINEHKRLEVATAIGTVPLVVGSEVPADLQVELWASNGAQPLVAPSHTLGLARSGQVAVVPLVVSNRNAGFLMVAFDSALAGEQAEAVVAATCDLATMAAPLIATMVDRERSTAERRDHYGQLIETQAFATVFQPIVDLGTGRPVGYEALTRFADGTRPDLVFADAGEVGKGPALEKAAALLAIERAEHLPAGSYVSINFSACTLLDVDFLAALTASTKREVVIEITEHDAVEDYVRLQGALATVRHHARIAVDDAGAGYSGLAHMRSLNPDVIKLDRALVSGFDIDPVGRAMVAGMVYFATETGSAIVAEGVETERELQTLIDLGVSHGQGYLLGRPSPASNWV